MLNSLYSETRHLITSVSGYAKLTHAEGIRMTSNAYTRPHCTTLLFHERRWAKLRAKT